MGHPICDLLKLSNESLQSLINVNTIVGQTINIGNNISIIPISRIKCSFAAGGTEFKNENSKDNRLPFGGGSGAAVSIHPVAFIIINEGTIKLLPAYNESSIDKIINYVPDMIEKANNFIKKDNEKDEDA